METYKTILTKLDIRKFSSKKIPGELVFENPRSCEIHGNDV